MGVFGGGRFFSKFDGFDGGNGPQGGSQVKAGSALARPHPDVSATYMLPLQCLDIE